MDLNFPVVAKRKGKNRWFHVEIRQRPARFAYIVVGCKGNNETLLGEYRQQCSADKKLNEEITK